jgi:hypothetical protein
MPPKRAHSPQSPTEKRKRMKTANHQRVMKARRLVPVSCASPGCLGHAPVVPPSPLFPLGPPPKVFSCASHGCKGWVTEKGGICKDCKERAPPPKVFGVCTSHGCSGYAFENGVCREHSSCKERGPPPKVFGVCASPGCEGWVTENEGSICRDCKERGPPPNPVPCASPGCKGWVTENEGRFCRGCKERVDEAGLAVQGAQFRPYNPSPRFEPEPPANREHMEWLQAAVTSYPPTASPQEMEMIQAMERSQSINPNLLSHLRPPLTGQEWVNQYGRTGSGIGDGVVPSSSPSPPLLYANHPSVWYGASSDRKMIAREQPPSSTQPSSAVFSFINRSDSKKGGSRNMNFKSKSKTRRLRRSRR